jgi:putative spermidine/putrescine transport system ATP-binding protein
VDASGGVPAVRFTDVRRHFGDVKAVDGVTLDIRDGEFFSMLGPSGSGKTTCLRLIAGFERPTSGTLELHGIPAAGVPPYERDVNTVFQDYALFPHMSVADNVAYGLTVRKVPRPECHRRVAEVLDLVRLPDVGHRRPAALSGGQRQRVALARALVNRPRVLLLDEPLGALDLKLRRQMQTELKAIQKQVGITFVYVTHDQEESLAMSDRLGVFAHGRLEQVGTPVEVYENPATPFVADFVGLSNLVDGEAARAMTGSTAAFTLRPEKLRILEEGPLDEGVRIVDGVVAEAVYLGMHTKYVVEITGGGRLTVVDTHRGAISGAAVGTRVRLGWRPEHARPTGLAG